MARSKATAMLVNARRNRLYVSGTIVAALTVAGCSASTAPPCNFRYVGSAGAIFGSQISPTNGATGVPNSIRTLVFNAPAFFGIVLEASSGASIQTTPTALPSPYPTSAPGPVNESGGYYAVSVPMLSAKTTYATGTLSDNNECAGNFRFYQFGTFTTQ